MAKAFEPKEEYPSVHINISAPKNEGEQDMLKLPRTCSLTYLLDMNYLGPISQMFSDGSYNPTFDFQLNSANVGTDPFVKPELGEMTNNYLSGSGLYQKTF
ncbi:unnamed protein product [Lupinus luteus]|uniref:Uncharacterized protein n=1 Tax=Lupinus luteus TaxID=3873 RepID=A0AAV1WNY3_LUPLU